MLQTGLKLNISTPTAAVLIVDQDRKIFDALAKRTEELGIQPRHAGTLQEALQKNCSEGYDIILARDILPDGAACYAVTEFLAEPATPEIIIYTTGGDPDQAELALKSGVWDYVIDPVPENVLPELMKRALRYRRSKIADAQAEEKEICHLLSNHGIIGRSSAMQNCLNLAARISQSDANVLITGESGTGKELFASAIHNFSSRAGSSLIIVDCAALPPTLVESILFGHAKGSFTGADKSQQGLIKQADGGTLFLDEIGEMPLEIQKKFLRVIQERRYRPVGSNVELRSDFRLIAATNRDLQAMSAEGTFREDLLFRLRTFHLELPPLRNRTADITELAYYFRDIFCKRNKLKKKKFSSDYLMVLTQYDWPGNVRELFQAMERSITDAQDSTTLYPKHLPASIRIQITRKKLQEQKESSPPNPQPSPSPPAQPDTGSMPTIKEAREQAIEQEERRYLEKLLARTNGSVKQCCTISGLSRSRLYDLLKKYQLSK
ncbi:MAG: sigma-54 dependent transcriptional regulator [Desulfobulbaceae bacterium]|jgi:two-component system NtrC family response regulator|nr:sigma-54 dependent transcriptional regulator [Desulfobulbaceae bacterium]